VKPNLGVSADGTPRFKALVARCERLEIFDELAEWHLMSAHYCIAVAVNEEGAAAAGAGAGAGAERDEAAAAAAASDSAQQQQMHPQQTPTAADEAGAVGGAARGAGLDDDDRIGDDPLGLWDDKQD
jgi:hypothetical protein